MSAHYVIMWLYILNIIQIHYCLMSYVGYNYNDIYYINTHSSPESEAEGGEGRIS